MLTSTNKKTDRISRIVNSLAQDLIYNVSAGKKKVPKHVQLGLTVTLKTDSVSTIRWLNRFGHSISYDEINGTEATLAEEQLNNENVCRYVPNNIQPGMFVTFVYDDCDHNTESLDNVTLYGTNRIVIQVSKHEFHGIVSHTTEPYIKSKHRPNPLPIQNLENVLNKLGSLISKHEDIVWSILWHKSSGEKQVIPAWKGFFCKTSKATTEKCIIGYLLRKLPN